MTSSQWILFFFLITCLLQHAAAEEQYEIKAEPGEDVTLQCQDPRKVSIELIKWRKPDLKSEKYVYYFRDGSMVIQYQLECYRGRVELKDPEMKDGDVSVILKNVNINDTGTYECYVGHRQDVQLISIINLIVEPGTNKGGGNTTLIVVVVPVVLVLFLVVVVGFLFYKKQRGSTDQSSYQQPPEQRTELQTV
ncbi:CD226 antigen-like [Anabas testudineus]|uniref:CD226 antigen-like n=1 Tax=Anabas testudineus TaxID=64144 RepID=UPI00143CEA06|nr:CD226 antigen-like [Anabas testudineus]